MMQSVEQRLVALAALKSEVTDEPLHKAGRYFDENCHDLAQCNHGDPMNYGNRSDGEAIALLWNLWREGAIAALPAPTPAPTDNAAMVEAWTEIGFLKEKLRQEQEETSVWKERAFASRVAAPTPAPVVEPKVSPISTKQELETLKALFHLPSTIAVLVAEVERLRNLPAADPTTRSEDVGAWKVVKDMMKQLDTGHNAMAFNIGRAALAKHKGGA